MLRRIRELESRFEDEINSEVHCFSNSIISSGRVLVEDEANFRLSVDKRWKENFCWFFMSCNWVDFGSLVSRPEFLPGLLIHYVMKITVIHFF